MSETKPPEGYEATEYVPQQVELMYEAGDLAAWSRIDSTYEILATRDGAIIAHLTEPEDRTFFRDLKPIVLKLAQLRAKAAAYDEAMRRLNDIEGLHDEECPWRWWGGFDPEKGTDLDGKWYKHGEEPVCQCPVGKAERFVAAEIAANRFVP